MGTDALVGLVVALAVPVWLTVEEMLHWLKRADRPRVSAGAPAVTAAPRNGAAARLRSKTA